MGDEVDTTPKKPDLYVLRSFFVSVSVDQGLREIAREQGKSSNEVAREILIDAAHILREQNR